ncbi:unnamed protein product [Moneuplotes crassus]|uniref:Band 7 domain-containing protein n=1 Tax=Euplotes crassus TaxID=5936 RepID=A0AAD1XMR3_EUPCR|nr:unnamed protein product [Moneuplotes crassus]
MFEQIFVIVICILAILYATSIHKIEEGHVGVYFRGGALMKEITEPGYHLKLPLITDYHEVQISVQTDKVTEIPCGTSGGVLVQFESIEVVNRLKKELVYETIKNYTVEYDKTWIFDKIHHEINQFCSKNTLQDVYIDKFDALDESLQEALSQSLESWAPGIEIISIRVTKPIIPKHLLKNYEARESEMTKLAFEIEAQKVKEKQAETKKKEAMIKAQTEAEVSKIEMEKKITEKEANKKIALIENEIELENKKTETDARYYKEIKEIEANSKRLTPEFLQYALIQAINNNTKMYFGDSIPKYIGENIDVMRKQLEKGEKQSSPP